MGTLFIVATPIGNLQDMTLRGLATLRAVDLIACEDTRVSSKLLTSFEISKSLISLHEHSDEAKLEKILQEIEQGKDVAYISDAGTPGVNDPGGKLVALARERGVTIVPIPGASALSTAISVCGFAMDDFHYAGFAPHKKGRKTFFQEVADRKIPTIFFESTHRIEKALDSLKEFLQPGRVIFIGRELTKQFETLYTGTIEEVTKQLQETSLKGEFVLIVGPLPKRYHAE